MKTMISIHCAIILVFASCMAIAENAGDNNSDKIRIILDADANNELDDQHAIAYMLFSGDTFDVEGITVNRTSNGGSIEKHVEEAERIVRLCALHPQIKVHRGASGNYEAILPHIAEPEFDGSEAVDLIIERALAPDDRKLVLMPIGKLTNIALALKKNPSIAKKVRIVWLGTNYPECGEYNFINDIPSLDPIIEADVPFEMAMVRYGKPSGTDAVRASLAEIKRIMPGKGPSIAPPVPGRHGGMFSNFGDYSKELFVKFRGSPKERPLFDMAAVAIVKNPAWADRVVIGAPKFTGGKWIDRPDNPRKVVIWENFDKEAIMKDFYQVMETPKLASPSAE